MTQSKPNIEVNTSASLSDVLKSEKWGQPLREAMAVGSVAVIEAHEQPVVEQVVEQTRKPLRPR